MEALNKHLRKTDRRWSSRLGLGGRPATATIKYWHVTKCHIGFQKGQMIVTRKMGLHVPFDVLNNC